MTSQTIQSIKLSDMSFAKQSDRFSSRSHVFIYVSDGVGHVHLRAFWTYRMSHTSFYPTLVTYRERLQMV